MTSPNSKETDTSAQPQQHSGVGRVMFLAAGLAAAGAIGVSLLSPKQAPATSPAAAVATLDPKIPPNASQIQDAGLATFLGTGVWRTGACDAHGNFQAFKLPQAQVEVGNGDVGQGENLQMLRARRMNDLVEVETRVCAPEPIGCNQTFEQYKVLSNDQLKEWHFEGRLPGQEPYVLVRDGMATDGSGAGRVFQRCAG